MALFDIEKIKDNLLPKDKIVWFKDICNRNVSDAVKKRLSDCAKQWDGYVHPKYEGADFRYVFSSTDNAETNPNHNINHSNFANSYVNRRWNLVDFAFYEKFIGDGKYLNSIEQLIKLICAEEIWCYPAHAYTKPKGYEGPVIDLWAAETGAALAITVEMLKDKLPEEIKNMAIENVRSRVLIPYASSDGYWWMGFDGRKVNNWNVWISSNIILCSAILCESDEEYKSFVIRACVVSENYIRSLPSDFTCDEGVRYWHLSGACLFDTAELLYDLTGGKVDLTKSKEVASACSYPVAMYDDYGLPANFGDATIEFYPDCHLLIRAGIRTQNKALESLGRRLYSTERLRSLHDNFYRQFKNIYTDSMAKDAEPLPSPEISHIPGINVVSMRRNGFFVTLKANHNGESHNHNDVGCFVLYRNGLPLFIDPGVDLYYEYSFGKNRYRLWYMRSEYHSVPVINGIPQMQGAQFKATELKVDGTYAEADISGAYNGVSPDGKWIRSVELTENGVKIKDRLTFDFDNTVLHYMLKEMPKINGNTLIFSDGTEVSFEGLKINGIETLDITGTNPPDGIIGDAKIRNTEVPSVLIPRIFEKQWNQKQLYRLSAVPTQSEITLTAKG